MATCPNCGLYQMTTVCPRCWCIKQGHIEGKMRFECPCNGNVTTENPNWRDG